MQQNEAALRHGTESGAGPAPKSPAESQVFYPDPPNAARMREEVRLRGVEFLNRCILLQEQIESMYQQAAVLDSMTKRITNVIRGDFVTGSRNVSAGEDAILRLMEAREELERKVGELLDVRKETAEMIARVGNKKSRIALEKRYLCGLKLEDIGTDMNCDISWVRRLLRRGEEAVGWILLER